MLSPVTGVFLISNSGIRIVITVLNLALSLLLKELLLSDNSRILSIFRYFKGHAIVILFLMSRTSVVEPDYFLFLCLF